MRSHLIVIFICISLTISDVETLTPGKQSFKEGLSGLRPSANSLSIFCRGQVWNKSPNMFQMCLVVKLLDVYLCFGRKLRPRDVKGGGAAEL